VVFDVPQDVDARRPLGLEVAAGDDRGRFRLGL
jgi:hypothetical protein